MEKSFTNPTAAEPSLWGTQDRFAHTCVCFHVCALSWVLDTHHYTAWDKITAAVSPHCTDTELQLNSKKTACKERSIPWASKLNPLLPKGLSHHSLVTLTDWADTELVLKVPSKNSVKWTIRGLVTRFFEDSTESCHIGIGNSFLCHQLGKEKCHYWEKTMALMEYMCLVTPYKP